MSRPLHFALLVSVAVHGLAAAAWYVPREQEAPAVLTASLRPAPAARAAPAVPAGATNPRQRGEPSRTQPQVAPVTAVAPAAAPAASNPPAEDKAAAPVAPSGQVSAPASAPAVPPPLEPPRFAAAYLANPPPPYPTSARRRGIEGDVRVEARVSAAGQVQEVKLAASAGDAALDDAALEAVRHWRFEPARRGSQAVEGWVSIPVVFRLN